MNPAGIRRTICLPLVVALAAALTACGPRSHSVKGKVTLDEEPLPQARISFTQEGNPQEYAHDITDDEGNYELRQTRKQAGVKTGKYRVHISTYIGPDEESDNPDPVSPERVPDKYSIDGEEIREVQPGANVFDFDIKSTDGPITQPDFEPTEE